MNFCNVIEEGDVLVELKYCERCGGLWLRVHASDEAYCEGCRAALASWPKNPYHRGHKRTGRNAFEGNREEVQVIGTLLGVAEMAGSRARPGSEVVQ